jgi:hypothetical protein
MQVEKYREINVYNGGQIEVLSRYLLGRAEKNKKIFSQGSRYRGRDANGVRPGH